MQETIQAIKDVWATLANLGWQPMPIVAAVIAMIALRSYFEPDVLQVTTIEAAKRMGRIKMMISAGVFFSAFMLQVGLQKPKIAFEWCLSIGFTIVDTFTGYVVSSSAVVRNFLKNSLFKGGSNAPVNPPM